MSVYSKTVFSLGMLKSLASRFLIAFGFFALLLSVADIFWPNKFGLGLLGLGVISAVSFLYSIASSWPQLSASKTFSVPDTKITIKVGDLYDEDGHLVIGMNDVFDTEIGSIISQDSLQGQFLERIYGGDRNRLDEDLKRALVSEGVSFVTDNSKTIGKKERYPLGTIAVLTGEQRKYFCVAYSKMGVDLKATSDIDIIWDSLQKLWEAVRVHGEQSKVSMSVIGSDLARVSGVSHYNLIEMILLSYIINSRVQSITKDFVLIIHRDNLSKVNFIEIKKFLQGIY